MCVRWLRNYRCNCNDVKFPLSTPALPWEDRATFHSPEGQALISVFPWPRLVHHRIAHPGWRAGALTVAILSDLHVTAPWLTVRRLGRIVRRMNGLGADLILLPGDFIADRKMPGRPVPIAPIAAELAQLAAPLGVYAVLGNHDWFDCLEAKANRFTATSVEPGLRAAGIGLLRNEAIRLDHGGAPFWLVGLDSQRPVQKRPRIRFHDPDRAFGQVTDQAPVILMAHEPDYFAEGDGRAFLQISGHTHGGQINFFGWRPYVPSRYGARYAWGHLRDGERHLVVSGGVGCSGVPLRFWQPPEITVVTIGGAG